MTARDADARDAGSGSFPPNGLLSRLALPLLMVLLGIAGFIFVQNDPPAPGINAALEATPQGAEAPVLLAYESSPVPPEGVVVPEGMIYVPGGTTRIGSRDGLESEQPVFTADVAPFLMDATPVTVAAFRAFVDATGYVTEAERFGNAGVLDPRLRIWRLIDGANWRFPLGPEATDAPDDHPVTQVSWNDAVAYCEWAGRRLPTEIEWEHAARSAAGAPHPYAWGNRLHLDTTYYANTWQGTFPVYNTGADGYLYTSPVGAFGKSPLGLTDMGGNVWEWTDSWYRPYADRDVPFAPTAESERVQRGGSFLCHESYCHGYRVSARSHSTPETALFHVGFRTVQDVPVR